MEGASGTARKSGTIQEDACTFMSTGDPISVVFMDGPAEACSDVLELPFIVAKARENFSHTLAVLFV
jgi:hypothetical protein